MLLFVCVKYVGRHLLGNLVRRMTRSEGTVGEWNEVLWCCPSLRLHMPDACRMEVMNIPYFERRKV